MPDNNQAHFTYISTYNNPLNEVYGLKYSSWQGLLSHPIRSVCREIARCSDLCGTWLLLLYLSGQIYTQAQGLQFFCCGNFKSKSQGNQYQRVNIGEQEFNCLYQGVFPMTSWDSLDVDIMATSLTAGGVENYHFSAARGQFPLQFDTVDS